MLHQLFGTDSQKTSVSLLILLTHLLTYLTYPPLALSSATLQAVLSRIYSCATTRPPPPPVTTVAPRCLFGLDLPEFNLPWHLNETKSLAIADLIWYSAGEKLISLTWFLRALRSFRRFTLPCQNLTLVEM